MKRWTDDHLRLANSVVDVRTRLRHLAERLVGHQRAEVNDCIIHLTRGLKARPVRQQPRTKRKEIPSGKA